MSEQLDAETRARYERRAPGWVIRCKRCGFTEPYGKYGVRIGATSYGKCTLGWCSRCRRICCLAIKRQKLR